VPVGDPVTAASLIGLADAANARLRSGLGDPGWRRAWYYLSLFRDLIQGRGNADFFHRFQNRNEPWPTAPVGWTDGVNQSSPLGAFVHGIAPEILASEAERLNLPMASDEMLPAQKWRVGFEQRGGWDPVTGAISAPALMAARSYAGLRYSLISPYLAGYGGWQPTPESMSVATPCDDPDLTDYVGAPINYEIKFTALSSNVTYSGSGGTCSGGVLTYDGTCQPGPAIVPEDKYDDHVAGIMHMPWAYYVVLNSGTVDYLPTNEWLEGPYTGPPTLSRTTGAQIERVFNRFAAQFRGDAQDEAAQAQRDPPPPGNQAAFDTQRFMRSQYLLAPARGVESGEDVLVTPPEQHSTGVSAGHLFDPWTAAEGCVIAALLVESTGLIEDARFDCLVDGEAVSGFTLPVQPGQAIHVLEPAQPSVTLRAASSVRAASLHIQAAELMDYKPQIPDLMLVLRLWHGG